MAMYHLSVKTVSRSKGRSATAASAYRSGEVIEDERTGLVHDYTRRKGVEHTEIFTPENSPVWSSNRTELWNAAELSENRKNSVVAREFEISIPSEFNKTERINVIREFSKNLVEHHKMAVDVAWHTPGKEGDDRNYHAHILCTTRRLTSEGFTEKTRELDTRKSGEISKWRERWADIANKHLEKGGYDERVDHRTLKEQRITALDNGHIEKAELLDRQPTVHLGANVVQMEKRGIQTERGDINRSINDTNGKIIELETVRLKIEKARKELEKKTAEHKDKISKREIVQKEVNKLQLQKFIDSRELLNKPEIKLVVNTEFTPEKIKQEWKKETDKQFHLVVKKAKKIHSKASTQFERQDKKLESHQEKLPSKPKGIFSSMKSAAYDQTVNVWEHARNGIQKRFLQLKGRVNLISDYMKRSGPYELKSRGERLAEMKAEKAQPKLAEDFHQVIKNEKSEVVKEQYDKIIKRQKDKQEKKPMKQESIEELKERTDANRVKSEKKEIERLEKAGRVAEMFDPAQQLEIDENFYEMSKSVVDKLNSNNKKNEELEKVARAADMSQASNEVDAVSFEQKPDKEKDKLRQKKLEQFKEKARSDRENSREKGR